MKFLGKESNSVGYEWSGNGWRVRVVRNMSDSYWDLDAQFGSLKFSILDSYSNSPEPALRQLESTMFEAHEILGTVLAGNELPKKWWQR